MFPVFAWVHCIKYQLWEDLLKSCKLDCQLTLSWPALQHLVNLNLCAWILLEIETFAFYTEQAG